MMLGAAVGDDAVDAAVRAHLLAQHADGVEGLDAGVQGVDARPRVGGGMRGPARVLEGGTRDAEQVRVEQGAVEAVDHHGTVHVLEDSRLDEPDLSGAALLGWRADDLDASLREPGLHCRQRRARARARRRDHVVAAGVPDAGQRVVLAEDGDGGPVASLDGRAEGGLDAAHARLDRQALGGKEPGEPRARLRLLEAELGVVVDLP